MIIFRLLLWVGVALALVVGWQFNQSTAEPLAAHATVKQLILPPLQLGDWVFRQGTSQESALIIQAGKSSFSHIGIVTALEPQILITHATTNDDPQHLNQVISSSLADFSSPTLAKRIAIARPTFLSAAQQQQVVQRVLSFVGQPFVLAVRESPNLYCTTLIAEAIQQPLPSFNPQWMTLNLPILRGEYLHPQAFAELTELDWIYP